MPAPTDARIDAYIDQAAPFAQPILRHLRALIHQACPEIEEAFKWSRPTYLYRGRLFCGTAAFKAHATFGIWHQDMAKVFDQEIGKSNQAMGVLGRITALEDLPSDAMMLRYIKTAKKLHDDGKPTRSKPQPRAPLPVPTDLAAALKKNKSAAATFEKLPPSHRREYIEWLTEAKRDETRQKRLATTVEWLAEGKSRNWKYLNC